MPYQHQPSSSQDAYVFQSLSQDQATTLWTSPCKTCLETPRTKLFALPSEDNVYPGDPFRMIRGGTRAGWYSGCDHINVGHGNFAQPDAYEREAH
ncbi:hypothetical protein HY490_00765 [Candidatus Woesearchaeota archaeon]|nr:hypothetical protein [Candidatus Woesearchaeota archaeon]